LKGRAGLGTDGLAIFPTRLSWLTATNTVRLRSVVF
jgi:hypothetical protein